MFNVDSLALKNNAPNPATHRLYVMWAMQHLVILQKHIKQLDNSNWFWTLTQQSVIENRSQLISENTAYQEASWRLLANQRVEDSGDGSLVIRDRSTGVIIPESDSNVILKPPVAQSETSGVDHPSGVSDGDYKVKDNSTTGFLRREKSHANKLTTEQRRENGRKGAAVKKENRMNNVRFEEAKRTRKCQIYALADGQVATFLGTRTQIGTADRFGQSEVTAGTCEAYCVFTPDRQLWVYNPTLKKLIRKRF